MVDSRVWPSSIRSECAGRGSPDPAYEGQAPEISEVFLGRLKRLADDFGLPWHYAPLHQHLRLARSRGWLAEVADAALPVPPGAGRVGPSIDADQS